MTSCPMTIVGVVKELYPSVSSCLLFSSSLIFFSVKENPNSFRNIFIILQGGQSFWVYTMMSFMLMCSSVKFRKIMGKSHGADIDVQVKKFKDWMGVSDPLLLQVGFNFTI